MFSLPAPPAAVEPTPIAVPLTAPSAPALPPLPSIRLECRASEPCVDRWTLVNDSDESLAPGDPRMLFPVWWGTLERLADGVWIDVTRRGVCGNCAMGTPRDPIAAHTSVEVTTPNEDEHETLSFAGSYRFTVDFAARGSRGQVETRFDLAGLDAAQTRAILDALHDPQIERCGELTYSALDLMMREAPIEAFPPLLSVPFPDFENQVWLYSRVTAYAALRHEHPEALALALQNAAEEQRPEIRRRLLATATPPLLVFLAACDRPYDWDAEVQRVLLRRLNEPSLRNAIVDHFVAWSRRAPPGQRRSLPRAVAALGRNPFGSLLETDGTPPAPPADIGACRLLRRALPEDRLTRPYPLDRGRVRPFGHAFRGAVSGS